MIAKKTAKIPGADYQSLLLISWKTFILQSLGFYISKFQIQIGAKATFKLKFADLIFTVVDLWTILRPIGHCAVCTLSQVK
jgi:hypothetical protein